VSLLIERVVRVNGEERQRSTVVAEYRSLDKIILPIATITPPLLTTAEIEVELSFDPPLSVVAPAPTEEKGEG
jgi:hypothetical protein